MKSVQERIWQELVCEFGQKKNVYMYKLLNEKYEAIM